MYTQSHCRRERGGWLMRLNISRRPAPGLADGWRCGTSMSTLSTVSRALARLSLRGGGWPRVACHQSGRAAARITRIWSTEVTLTLPVRKIGKKGSLAHTRLPSVGFRSWSRFLAVSLQWWRKHKPGGRLPLLSARPTVTIATLKRTATNFAAWWTEVRWEWRVCLRLLPDSVTAAIWT